MTKFANPITSTPVFNLSERKLVLVAVVGMLVAFAVLLIFVGGGAVRQVPIYWKEKIEATVAFKTIDGQLKIVGTKGNGQVNPTLISRTGDTTYILTVVNEDINPHMFYIEGINAHTKLLRQGQNDTITIFSKKEGTYNYYDRFENVENLHPLGQFKALKVAGDEWS
jgi:hypothetical protein